MSEAIKIKKVLERDMAYRKMCRWPLVCVDELEIKSLDKKSIKKVGFYLYEAAQGDSTTKELSEYFPHLNYLLSNYNLCAAGGAIFKDIIKIKQNGDVDLFFYNCTVDTATRQLVEIADYFSKLKFRILYSTNCTTISFGKEIYQFIHRIYPTKDSIIGGFDLGTCHVLYDGKNYLATPLGQFCISHRVNIFDTSRRSTSYEHRLIKYERYYASSILFVSLNTDFIAESTMIFPKLELSQYLTLIRHTRGNSLQASGAAKSDYTIESKQIKCTEINYTNLLFGKNCLQWESDGIKVTVPEEFDVLYNHCPFIKLFQRHLINGLDSYYNNTIKRYSNYFEPSILIGFIKKLKAVSNNKVDAQITNLTHPIMQEVQQYLLTRIQPKVDAFNNEIRTNGPLSKIIWITENPGRQWTASINPTFSKASEYFNPLVYKPFLIGIPTETETLLRLLTKHKIGPFAHLTRDTLTLIFYHIIFFLFFQFHSRKKYFLHFAISLAKKIFFTLCNFTLKKIFFTLCNFTR